MKNNPSAGQMLGEIVFCLASIPFIRLSMYRDRKKHEKAMQSLQVQIRANTKSGRYKAAKNYFSLPKTERGISVHQYKEIIVNRMPWRTYEAKHGNR